MMPLFFACMTPEEESDNGGKIKTYAIGDTGPSGAGKVFYITDGGLHGLEAAPSDQSKSKEWSNVKTFIGTTGTAIGTGLANSNAIIAQAEHTSSAAKLCRDYAGGGMNDWFIPSKDELDLLYAQDTAVGGFDLDGYWSSSEYNVTSMHGTSPFSMVHRIMAIRAV